MRILRWLGIAFLALVALLVGTGVAARFSDGPIALFPGGELIAGELYQGPEPDWTFARDIPEMEFQLLDPPRSRTIWLLVNDKKLYIVSGYMRSRIAPIWKKWPAEAERDGRAIVRIDGKRYERDVVRIHDAVQIEPLAAEVRRKYGVPRMSTQAALAGDAWFYALPPRGGAATVEEPAAPSGEPSPETSLPE
jgi:hypothetical protein